MKPVSITGVKEQIKSIVDELRGIEVEAIYLFGSYAKGNAKPISDIDISVITKRNHSYIEFFKKISVVKRFVDRIKEVIKE